MAARSIPETERRARLARRHRLTPSAQHPDPTQVCRSLVAYHATDPASVYLAAAARTGLAAPETLDRALYEQRTLVRTLGMRRAALLPGLDPTIMGWAMPHRGWYLPEACRPALYDRNGNLGPSVWWDGQVVGGWARRDDGSVAYRLLLDIGEAGRAAVARAAGRLEHWLGDVGVTPRFRTPLEQELTA